LSLLPLAERDDEFLDEAALRARYPYPILLFATYCFLLTAHYLLLTTYYLLLTAYSRMHAFALCRTEAGWWPLLTTHYSLLTTHYSLLTTHYSLLVSTMRIPDAHLHPCHYPTPTPHLPHGPIPGALPRLQREGGGGSAAARLRIRQLRAHRAAGKSSEYKYT
jgi:hypothetical protein